MITQPHYRAGTKANALPGSRGLMGEMEDVADGLMVPGGACCDDNGKGCLQTGGMPSRSRQDVVAGVCGGRMLGFHEGSTSSMTSRPWPGE